MNGSAFRLLLLAPKRPGRAGDIAALHFERNRRMAFNDCKDSGQLAPMKGRELMTER
jgi:hypothetical protein